MLAELLLVLAGHRSSFFVPAPAPPAVALTFAVNPSLAALLHPGEIAALNNLAQIGFHYTAIRRWAVNLQSQGRAQILSSGKGKARAVEPIEGGSGHNLKPDQYLCALAGGILEVLRDYELLLVEVEARILSLDEGLVQDASGYVPLSSLLATLSRWEAPLGALTELINTLDTSPYSIGHLLDLVARLSQHGNARIGAMFASLHSALLSLFLMHLSNFLLAGVAPSVSTLSSPAIAIDTGSDPSSPQHRIYALNNDMIPRSISMHTRASILYVGRVAATLARENRYLPRTLTADLRKLIMAIKSLDNGALDQAIQRAREDVGEWLWKNVLTGPQVIEAIETFGQYLLGRNAEYSISVIREIKKLRMDKLTLANPKSSSSIIRDQDLDLALLRASVGTSAETDRTLEKLRFHLERGPFRPLMPAITTSEKAPSKRSSSSSSSIKDLFSSFLLGTPLTLATSIGWPMDLFMTPPAMAAYTEIHAYLTAIRDTNLRVLECWTSLSAAQRRRRKWTGVNEGGSVEEAQLRQILARTAWGMIRTMLFFLDQLQSHFMLDIIDVQHKRLLEQLESINVNHGKDAVGQSRKGSLRGSARGTATERTWEGGDQVDSPRSSVHGGLGSDARTIRSRPPPTGAVTQSATHLDFLSLRQIHSRHLSSIREGLLISDISTAVIIRDVLEVCRRFTALVERWGGDVLPELLTEGPGGAERGDLLHTRSGEVHEIDQKLQELLLTFFKILMDVQSPSTTGDTSSTAGGGASFTRTSRATQILQMQSSRLGQPFSRHASFSGGTRKDVTGESKSLEGDMHLGRHLEQLLLRLDFNGMLTAWQLREDGLEGEDTRTVLQDGII